MREVLAVALGIIVFMAVWPLSDIASRLFGGVSGTWLAEAVLGLVGGAAGMFFALAACRAVSRNDMWTGTVLAVLIVLLYLSFVATGIFLGQLDEAMSQHAAGVFIAKVAAPCLGFVAVALGSLRS